MTIIDGVEVKRIYYEYEQDHDKCENLLKGILKGASSFFNKMYIDGANKAIHSLILKLS